MSPRFTKQVGLILLLLLALLSQIASHPNAVTAEDVPTEATPSADPPATDTGEDTGDKYAFLPYTDGTSYDPTTISPDTPAEEIGPILTEANAGRTFYVATHGNDRDPGTLDRPWRTIQRAARLLVAGDTVLIRGGTYDVLNSDNPIAPSRSGNAGAPITFKPYPGETVVLQGHYPAPTDRVQCGISIYGQSYIRIEGLTIRGFRVGICVAAPTHHDVIQNNILEYNSVGGVSSAGHASGNANGGDYLTVEGNIIRHNGFRSDGTLASGAGEGWGSGIILNPHLAPYRYDWDDSQFHIVVRGNIIYHNYDGTGGDTDNDADHTDGNGVIVDYGGDMPPTLIENNVIFDNGGRCIHVYGGRNVWIVGNTCYQNQQDRGFKNASTARGEMTGHDLQSPFSMVDNVHVLNNIVYATSDRLITYYPGVLLGRVSLENNLWYGGYFRDLLSPLGINGIQSDPQFVNPSTDPQAANFRLQGSSPAINRGNGNLRPGAQLNDLDWAARPQGAAYDIGAYEFGAVAMPTATPTVPLPTVAPTDVPPTVTPTPLPTDAPPTVTPTPLPTDAPAATPAPPRATGGLLGYWPLDEGGNTSSGDASGHGFGGTLNGEPGWTTGVHGNALRFDGTDDYLVIADHDSLSPYATTGEMTLVAWVYVSQYPSTAGQGRTPLVAKGVEGEWEYALYLYANGQVGFSLWQPRGASHNETWGGTLPLNGWHQVMGVAKAGQFIRVYLDGALVIQDRSFQGTASSGRSPLFLARRGDGQHFNGVIDEVQLYNRALAAEEAQALFASAAQGMFTLDSVQLPAPELTLTEPPSS